MTEQQSDYLPPGSPPASEGKTMAAWVTTWVVLLGAVVSSVGFVVGEQVWIWVGAAVLVLGLVVGRVLAILGHGKRVHRTGEDH